MEGTSTAPTMDAEQHLIAAIHHIGRALEAGGNSSDDMKRFLADLDVRFSTMIKLSEGEAERNSDIEYRLKCAQKEIMNLWPNRLNLWDHSGHQELLECLQAVEEVQRLKESLVSTPSNQSERLKELVDEAHRILQIAMEKLQDVLVNILAQNKQCFEHEYNSFYSCEENIDYEKSLVSTEGDSVEGASRRESSSTEPEEILMDFIHPDIVPYLKSIAKVMFASHYNQEFCQAFISFWRHALDEYLILLNMEKFSIEEVLKMDWDCLSSKIKKWCQAARSVFGFYLVGEKRLFDQVLEEFGSASSTCFIEATKASVLCLLNFGHAVAIGPLRPERLFSLLDMYEVLADYLHCLNEMYAEEAGSVIRMEFNNLLSGLGHSAKVIFLEFGDQVASDSSAVPFANGRIPHLTKYVMNYITLVDEYIDTLNFLLEEQDPDNSNQAVAAEAGQNIFSYISCPLGHHLQSLTSTLEAKLDEKSNLFGDQSLKHIFLMNNIHYMVQKITNSKIGNYFGVEWIKEHIVKFQQHARSYERVTWSPLLSFLRDDGTKTKSILKQRCRDFSTAFEETYKVQRRWYIPDLRLREDVRLQTIQNVLHAYRAFLSRITSACVCDRYIKYTVEQLENHIWDLFEGSQKSFNHTWRS